MPIIWSEGSFLDAIYLYRYCNLPQGGADTATHEAQIRFLYTLYLANYAGLFEIKLARLTQEFPTSDFGTKGAVFPARFVTYQGAHYNKIPLTVWKQLLEIVTRNKMAQSTMLLSRARSQPLLSLNQDVFPYFSDFLCTRVQFISSLPRTQYTARSPAGESVSAWSDADPHSEPRAMPPPSANCTPPRYR